MEISKQLRGEALELKIQGRVDGYWADHLSAAVDQEIRQGHHHIQLDLSEVGFLSSAGIGTLVRLYKDLKSIQGSFVVSNCSRTVLKVLQLSKLEDILVAKAAGVLSTADRKRMEAPAAVSKVERPEAIYELYPLAPDAKLECEQIGNAKAVETCGLDKAHCRTLQFSDSTFAIGLGAIGDDFEDCQRRIGEFIIVGGAVAYLPTDGTNVPDFLLSHGGCTPEVQVCSGIACHGGNPQPFSSLLRFEAKGGVPITLTALLGSCLELSNRQQIGVVIIAEAAGLIGAALRRSPFTTGAGQKPFEFPRIRDWLTFTAEPAYANRVALVAGIALRGQSEALAPFIRPFPTASGIPLAGHFHAAAFSYRPVQRGAIELKASIKTLFEGQALEGILHLLTDDRAISGAGESEFVRGACWMSPISSTTAEKARA
jgi:anti-anti-sigma factor